MRFLILLIWLAIPTSASAESDAEVAARWGLLGTWTSDCTKPPMQGNTYYSYVRRGDGVVLERDGGSYQDANPITAAAITAEGYLEYQIVIRGAPGTRLNVLAKDAAGRSRMMTNRQLDGPFSVREGRLLPNGPETPWTTRCIAKS